MPRTTEKRVTKLTVDMSNVPERREGGRSAHVPPGDYLLKLTDAYFTKVKAGNKNAGKPMAVWIFSIEKPASHKSAGSIYYRTGLWEEAVFSFRNLLQDLLNGKAIPKRAVDVDLKKYIGKLVGATLDDAEPYNNRVKSEIINTFTAGNFTEQQASDEEGDDEEDDEDELQTSDDDDEDEESEDEDDDDL